MASYQVTILDMHGRILRQFESVGGYRQAIRAGNEAADSMPNARHVNAKPI